MLDSYACDLVAGGPPVHLKKGEEHEVSDHLAEVWASRGMVELVSAPALAARGKSTERQAGRTTKE